MHERDREHAELGYVEKLQIGPRSVLLPRLSRLFESPDRFKPATGEHFLKQDLDGIAQL
jgi:hypothetical protein